jgi:hypothetical protein
MVGVPPNHYAYTLIPHDETRKNLPPTCTRVMRSAVHGKIENVRLPTGGYLQPFYGPKTRLLTCLFLAKWSIENNWSFGLDPGRERNVVPSRQPTKLSIFKAFIEKKVKAAKRCSDGKPDPVAILDVLYEIGIDEIETAKGYAGRRGVRFHFEDHPKPVLFFGEQYMALHDYLREKHINENENRTDNKPSAWEQYFPGGQLIRTEEYTSRIAVGLQQCLDARAKFNIERYNLNRPIFVMGGLVVGDVNRGGGGPDVLDGSDVRAKSGVEGPTGGCPGSQDAKCGKAGRPLTIEVRKEGQLDDSGTSHLSPEVSGSHCDKAAKDLTGGNAGEPLAPGMPFDLVLPMASQESDTKTETSDRASASPGPPCPIPAAPIEASMMGIEKLPCPGDGADGLRRAKEANGRSAATSATGKSDEPVASKGPSNDEQPMSHQTEEYVSENLPAKVKPNRGGKYVTPCPKQDGSPDLCLVQGIRAKSGVEGPTGGCPGSQDAKCGKAGHPLTIEVRKEGQLDDSGTSHLSPEVSGSHCDKAAKDLTGGNAGEPLAPGMPFDLVLPMASQESDTKTETSDRASASPGPPCPIPAAPIEASMMGIEKLPCPGDGADGLRRAKEANGRSAATSATGKSDEPVASKGPSNDEQPMSHQTEEYVSENLPAKVKPNRGGKYVTPCPKQDGSPDLCLVQGMLATASIPHHPSQQVPDAIIPCAPIFAWRVDKVDPIPCFDQSDANPEQTGATFSNPYENDSTNTKPSEKQHPDPCGARTAVGINPDSVATVVARALREILRAIEQLQIGINAFVEELRRSTRGLIDADHRLGVQGQQLDQAIEQHSPEAAALDDTRDDECPTLLGTREFLRRVKKPASPILRALPSPKVEQIDPSHNI